MEPVNNLQGPTTGWKGWWGKRRGAAAMRFALLGGRVLPVSGEVSMLMVLETLDGTLEPWILGTSLRYWLCCAGLVPFRTGR